MDQAAREWVADAFNRIGNRAFDMPMDKVWAIIDREYDGGRDAFIANCGVDTFAQLRAELAQVEADSELDMQVQAYEDSEHARVVKGSIMEFFDGCDVLVTMLREIASTLSPLPVAAPKRSLFRRIFNRKA